MSINICVIGLGTVGKKRFEIFNDHSDVDEVSFFDPKIKKFYNIHSFNNISEIFSNSNIDAIAICTPNQQKIGLIEKAYKSKMHIFCEKPPVMSYLEMLSIEKLEESFPDIKVQFGFNHRQMSHYKSLKKIILSEEYGKPLWLRGVYGKGFDNDFFKGWRADNSLSGGGIFFDQGIHMLDMVIELLGELSIENVLIDNAKDYPGIDINMFIHLRSKSGVPISIHSSMLQWKHKLSLEVGTEKAIIGIDGILSSTKSYGSEKIRIDRHWKNNFVESEINQFSNPDYYSFNRECNSFVDSIINNKVIANGTVKDAKKVMKLVDKIYSYNSQ